MSEKGFKDRYQIDFRDIDVNESQEYIPNSESGLENHTGMSLGEVCDMILDPSVDSRSLLDISRLNYKKDKVAKCLESKIELENAVFESDEKKEWAIALTKCFFDQEDFTKESVLNSFSEDFLYVIGIDVITKGGVIDLKVLQERAGYTNNMILKIGVGFVIKHSFENVMKKHSRAISNIIQDIRFRFK